MSKVRKDYRVEFRVINNNLVTAIEAMGYKTIPVFAKAFNISYSDLNTLVSMKTSPLKRDGTIKPVVERLMVVLNKPFDDLFNEQQVEGVEYNRSQVEMTAEHMFALMNPGMETLSIPDSEIERSQLQVRLDQVLSSLKQQECDVLRKYFGLDGPVMTQAEIAAEYNLSNTRIQHIVEKGLRKMRHPCRANRLLAAMEPVRGLPSYLNGDECSTSY